MKTFKEYIAEFIGESKNSSPYTFKGKDVYENGILVGKVHKGDHGFETIKFRTSQAEKRWKDQVPDTLSTYETLEALGYKGK